MILYSNFAQPNLSKNLKEAIVKIPKITSPQAVVWKFFGIPMNLKFSPGFQYVTPISKIDKYKNS
jgi:hypothetical protein